MCLTLSQISFIGYTIFRQVYFYGIINHSLLFFIQIFILFIHLVSRKDVYEGGIGSSEIPFSPYIYALYETIFR